MTTGETMPVERSFIIVAESAAIFYVKQYFMPLVEKAQK